MAAIADSIHAADEVQIEWRQDPFDHHLACPECWRRDREDRAMKEHRDGGLICSHRPCRFVLSAEERERAIPSHVSSSDFVCPKCRRAALKAHHVGAICSNRMCRFQLGGPEP